MLRTGNDDISVMLNEIFDYADWILDNVDIPPIDPFVLRLQGSVQEVVPRSANALPPGTLRFEAVPLLHSLREFVAEVFFNDHYAVTTGWIRRRLKALDLIFENFKGVILGVSYQKSQIDRSMRIREFRKKSKVSG